MNKLSTVGLPRRYVILGLSAVCSAVISAVAAPRATNTAAVPRVATNYTVGLRTTNAPAATNVAPAGPVTVDLATFDRDRILKWATSALVVEPVTITKYRAKFSAGTSNDFYSNGDFWWPNPGTANGLPYVKHDGETNPNNFMEHRKCLSQLRDNVAALAAAYKITGNNRYATVAAEWLRVFFVDPATRMNPDLKYAQAIPGLSQGRGIGIIDTLPLVEVPKAVEAMQNAPAFTPELSAGLKKWFADYLTWMTVSTNGEDAANMPDDHGVVYWLQITSFAEYVGDDDQLTSCRNRYKFFFLPNQMAADGSFPHEMARSRSYGYSICQVDNLTAMCQILSNTNDDLWHYAAPEKGTVQKSVDFIYPYLENKSRWPKNPDLQGSWPMRQSNLLFAGLAYNEPRYIALWKKLDPDPTDEDVRRNAAVMQPILWIK